MSGFSDEPNLIIAFSGRKHGNMSLYYGETSEALNNRRAFLSSLGIDHRDLVCARQVHGDNIRYVTEDDKGAGASAYGGSIADTDGFITDRKNLPIAIFTADCPSIFIYDPSLPAIGLLHCGWRSSRLRIASKAVRLMQKEFNSNPKDLYAGFGSGIRGCCYRVSEDFSGYFTEGLIRRSGQLYLDLTEVNTWELLACGVKKENIYPPQACTFCHNDEFFSFRKEGPACGRMLSVMMIK
ncbi:MAG: peptidoglycan editing factor PgeF [Candidatus Omnitrophota bacterium]